MWGEPQLQSYAMVPAAGTLQLREETHMPESVGILPGEGVGGESPHSVVEPEQMAGSPLRCTEQTQSSMAKFI